MDILDIQKQQRAYFNSNETKSLDFRLIMLKKLYEEIIRREEDIFTALKADLNKSKTESYLTEVSIVLDEIKMMIKNLNKWSKRKRVKTPFAHMPSSSFVYREPFGITLILAPWNYPFQLAMMPLVGAIAGGNTVIIKPSRNSKHTNKIIFEIVSSIFDENYVACVDISTSNEEILNGRYDLIFFTGSPNGAKEIMNFASENLTPIILELGGKSPCIVHKTADLDLAAKRLCWGKFLNSGQTCVAPDYLLIDESIKKIFIDKLRKEIEDMYNYPLQNEEFVHIVNDKHFNELVEQIESCREKKEIIGGKYNRYNLCIEPTIVVDASWDDPIMESEIFGPVLPIIGYSDLDEEIKNIKDREKPLALYIFSNNKKVVKKVIDEVSFGGGCVNDVVMHVANNSLPFGGVGYSGMGSYHGKYTFETFTRKKGIEVGSRFIDIPLRYPPYTLRKNKWIRRIMK